MILLFIANQGNYLPTISTSMITFPVDCVLAGEPDKYKDKRVPFEMLKGIFGE